jgi:sugar lactone lactonase YvrE
MGTGLSRHWVLPSGNCLSFSLPPVTDAEAWASHCVLAVHASLCVRARNDGWAFVYVQPSGISLSADGRELWVADSESSTVRSMDTAEGGGTVSRLPSLLFFPL